jgi:hypothetical protein
MRHLQATIVQRVVDGPLMSALGQKQTLEHVRVMSALPPIADIGTGPYQLRRSNSGSLAIFAAIRRASSLVRAFTRYQIPLSI